MKYTLGRPITYFEVWALHRDGSPWGQALCYSGHGISLDEPCARRPAMRFLTHEKALLAWSVCRDVFNDTLPDVREIGAK